MESRMKSNSLTDFIDKNPNWKDLLSDEHGDFSHRIKNSTRPGEENLWIFSYNQIRSKWSRPENKYARGIILEIKDGHVTKVVRRAFDKFFNSGEGYVDKIDWSAPGLFASLKMDGSLCSSYHYNGKWHWSTSGMFHADDANLSELVPLANDGSENAKTFQDLIDVALRRTPVPFDDLEIGHTYTFELTSPSNRIVTPYLETGLTFIGERDNETGDEIDVKKSKVASKLMLPEEFQVRSEKEADELVERLGGLKEGLVIRGQRKPDGSFARCKMKSREYVKCHHIRGENNFSKKQLFEVIQANETSEVEAYFPELKGKIETTRAEWSGLKEILKSWVAKGVEHKALLIAADPMYKFSDVTVRKAYANFVSGPKVPAGVKSTMFFVWKEDPEGEVDKMLQDISWKDYKSLQLKVNNLKLGD